MFCPKKSFYFIPRAFTKTYDLSTWKQFSSSPHNDWIMDFPSSKIWRLIKKNESFFIECHRCVLLLSCADFLFNTSNSSRPFFASKLIMSVVILKQRLVSTARCINKRGCKSNVGATLPSKIPILAPKSKKETIDLITQNANETEVESRSAGKRGLNAFCVVVFHVLVLLASTLVINCRKHSQLSVFMWF